MLAGLAAALVQGRVALGPRAGARVQQHGDAPDDVEPITPGPCHAQVGGHADTVKRILRHLGLPMDLPASQPARRPIASSLPTFDGRTALWPSMPPADDTPDAGVSGPPCTARRRALTVLTVDVRLR